MMLSMLVMLGVLFEDDIISSFDSGTHFLIAFITKYKVCITLSSKPCSTSCRQWQRENKRNLLNS